MCERDIHLVDIADTHQLDVALEEANLLIECRGTLARVVEDMAEHMRKFHNARAGHIAVELYHRVDVVQGVHQEVGVNLILQILHLRLDVLLLEDGHTAVDGQRAVVELNHSVGTRHKDTNQDVPIPLKVRKRGFVAKLDVALEVAEVENLDDAKDDSDYCYERGGVEPIAVAKKKLRSKESVVREEDDEVGRNLCPRDNNLVKVNLVLRHQLGIHKGDQEYRYPHQRVEHILAQFPTLEEFHIGKCNDF